MGVHEHPTSFGLGSVKFSVLYSHARDLGASCSREIYRGLGLLVFTQRQSFEPCWRLASAASLFVVLETGVLVRFLTFHAGSGGSLSLWLGLCT